MLFVRCPRIMPTQTRSWRPKPRRRSFVNARVDSVSITVFFCLLLSVGIFIRAIDASSTLHHGRTVDLPTVHSAISTPNALRPDAIQVAVWRNGDIFVGGAKEAAADVPDRLRELSEPGVERRVYLRVDMRAKYVDVAVVIDCIRAAGISNVTFLTESYAKL